MPEIPDITVFAENIKSRYGGKKLSKIVVVNGKKLADTQDELSKALEGSTLDDVYRSGKELRYQFSNGNMLGMHLMLTGDMIPFEKSNERKSTIVQLEFEGGPGLALTDRMKNAHVKLNPVDKEGIDALDKKLDYKYLKNLLARKTAVKNILLDQHIIRGIGNGYSDEILWETRISPFSRAEAIPDEKIKELANAIRTVLTTATKQIRESHPGLIFGEIKEFLKIHTKKKTESPTGYQILIKSSGSRDTFYTEEQVLYE